MSTYSKGEPPRINSGSELALRATRERLARLNIERQFATGAMREHLDNAAAILQRQLDALAEGLAQEEQNAVHPE